MGNWKQEKKASISVSITKENEWKLDYVYCENSLIFFVETGFFLWWHRDV